MKLNIVPPRTGIAWVREGIATYFKRPLAFTGLFFMIMLLTGLLGIVPVIGVVVALMALPILNLGFMAATKEVLAGRFPMPKVLFTGLLRDAPTRTAMLQLGALYAVGFVIILAVSALFDGGEVAKMYLGLQPLDVGDMQLKNDRSVMLLTMALYVPLAAAFWHAPALLFWHGVSPVKSLFFSAVACWRNLGAFVLYVAVFMAVLVGVMTVFMVLLRLLSGGDPNVAVATLMPAALIGASVFFASMYTTFRDCFEAGSADPSEPTLLN